VDEAQLIEQSTSGSVDAFSELVGLHQARVRAYIARYVRNPDLIDDIAQDVFIAAFRTLKTYAGDAPLSLWLIGIARNRALTHLRDEGRRRTRESGRLDAVVAEWDAAQLQNEPAARSNELAAMELCIQNLPENSARLVREHYFKSRSSAEIAAEQGKKEGAVRMTLLRIRQGLRDCIETRLINAPTAARANA